jgi:hypothetical protein
MIADIQKMTLAADLTAALSGLPTEPGQSHERFFTRFATHFAKRALFGGRLTQRIKVSRDDYERLLEDGVKIEADVQATFEIARAGVKGGIEDKRSRRFKNSRGLTVESIKYSGRTAPQQMLDMWAQFIEKSPAPIEISFIPLHDLLTPDHFPTDSHVADRRKALEHATNSFLASRGQNVQEEVVHPGDQVLLSLVAGGRPRSLAATEQYASTRRAPDEGEPPPDQQRWILVDASNGQPNSELDLKSPLALRSVTSGRFLDAQAGSDDTYSVGDGLTAPLAAKPG